MHKTKRNYRAVLAAGGALCALNVATAVAAPLSITTPNLATAAGSTSVTLNGQTFVNQGLQGMGRITAGTKDFNGDTFGAFSGMDIKLSTWTKNANGTYSGTLFALPDRGPNGVGPIGTGGSDFPARYSQYAITFTPYTGTTSLPVSTASQNQVQFTAQGGLLFKDFTGKVTTGYDPGTGAASIVTQNGTQFPGLTSGPATGKITMDSESIRFMQDGTFYVGDEYGANVYYFDAAGNMKGAILPPPALIPRDATGQITYSSNVNPVTGRRPNQGIEGFAVTPDGKRLVTLLQSATIQDSTGSAQTRTNTRLMVYDISTTRTPTAPIADYVMQLPVYTTTGNGTAPNAAAAQSEILAINGTQFLVLSRDGNGLGVANLNPVFKSILLVDTANATNIVGTPYEQSTTPISPGGNLVSSITPVQYVELVNMLNTTQLAKFGENINNTAPTRLTISEKWEGMALVPALDEANPRDFFLFVGNDNDFLATSCTTGGVNCAQTVDSDAHILVYRLTLPTAVDPEFLASMLENAPVALEMMGQDALALSGMNNGNIVSQLNAQRRAGLANAGFNAWVSGTYRRDDIDNLGAIGTNGNHDGFLGSVGLTYALSENFIAGVAVGYGVQDAKTKTGFSLDGDAWSFGGYVQYTNDMWHAAAGISAGQLNLDKITRPAAYGMTAVGNTAGSLISTFIEGGYTISNSALKHGPIVGYASDHVELHAYTEAGAAGGNMAVPAHSINSQVFNAGWEAFGNFGSVMPYGRVTYNAQVDNAARSVAVSLAASAQAAMATSTVSVPTANHDFVELNAGLQGLVGQALWNVGYSAHIGMDDRTNHLVRVGLSYAF